ncbi:hypothetical protein [Kitasatospora sp. NPDC004272]
MTDTQPAPTPDIDAIQARHDNATSGTWYLQPRYGPDFVAAESSGYEHGIGTLDFGVGDQADADREFVLNAHTDMGKLIARIRDLEAEHDRLQAQLADRAAENRQIRTEAAHAARLLQTDPDGARHILTHLAPAPVRGDR